MLKSKSKIFEPEYADYSFLKDLDNVILYQVINPPLFGKLQYRFDNFFQDISGPRSFLNTFTQKDIDQGRLN